MARSRARRPSRWPCSGLLDVTAFASGEQQPVALARRDVQKRISRLAKMTGADGQGCAGYLCRGAPLVRSSAGLDAEVIALQWIPLLVFVSRASWLEKTDRLDPGRREEELLVIRADKP